MSSVPPSSRHIISILVEDRYGELARIVGLFSGRGYNIDSLAVNQSIEPGMSRVVLTTRGDAQVVEQIIKQVNKLVRVHKVRHLVGDHLGPQRRGELAAQPRDLPRIRFDHAEQVSRARRDRERRDGPCAPDDHVDLVEFDEAAVALHAPALPPQAEQVVACPGADVSGQHNEAFLAPDRLPDLLQRDIVRLAAVQKPGIGGTTERGLNESVEVLVHAFVRQGCLPDKA